MTYKDMMCLLSTRDIPCSLWVTALRTGLDFLVSKNQMAKSDKDMSVCAQQVLEAIILSKESCISDAEAIMRLKAEYAKALQIFINSSAFIKRKGKGGQLIPRVRKLSSNTVAQAMLRSIAFRD